MPRTAYRNGDDVSLGNCDGCNPSAINGILCHETGCPDAWRDYAIDCFACGCEFLRTERYRNTCDDCLNPEPFEEEEEEEEEDSTPAGWDSID